MKKLIAILLVAMLAISVIGTAFAEDYIAPDYEQYFANESSFETLEEAHAHAPEALAALTGKSYIPDPALDTYPAGTTYVYRSAGIYTDSTAAYRMNTNILVYTDDEIENQDAALAYLKDLGLTDIIDQAHGSVVLVTPIDKESGFGTADQYAYFKLQAAMCNLGYAVRGDDGTFYYADNTYFGGLTYRYAIGINGGASFLCNYVANTLDYAGRLAGMLLVNPDMNNALQVAYNVPAYIVNGTQTTIDKFIAANEAYATEETADLLSYFNQQFPVRKVAIAKDGEKALADYVKDAYYSLFVKAMCTPVVKGGLFVAANEFSSYNWNQAPYTITARNAIIDGATADGIYVVEHQEDRFSNIQASNGEYLRTWYEFLPEEVLDGSAKEHSIPLILANHGGGDDPVQAVDELGLITVAGQERVAVVAPRYATDVPGNSIFSASPFDVNGQSLPALVEYMLATYPALDPSRVYVTGYSMGGAATVEAITCAPQLFAAAVPMAAGTPWGMHVATEEEAAVFEKLDLAVMFTTSGYDLATAYDSTTNTIGSAYQEFIKYFADYNEIPDYTYDFEQYPVVGFKADKIVKTLLNGEYENTTWYMNNAEGIPLVAVNFTELLPHGLHPDYGTNAWNFMKHYSRNTETGELVYNP